MSSPAFAMKKKQQKLARLIKKGKLREAAQLLQPLCKQQPRDTHSWMALASLYGQLADYQGVLRACRQVCSIAPQLPQPYSLMGNALACLERFEEAGEQYRKAMALQPDDPGIINNLGNALYLEGKLEEAAKLLEQAVQLQPAYADAHNNLGNVYKALNERNRAIHHFQLAIQNNSALFEAHLNLADIFLDRIGHPEAAEQHYHRAVELKPDNRQARAGLMNVYCHLGRLDDALDMVHKIQKLFPALRGALASEADILERKGDYAGAYQRASSMITGGSPEPLAVDVLLRICQRTSSCEEAIVLAEQLLANADTKTPGIASLRFSLGKLYDRLGDFDNAFRQYQAANELNDAPFDPDAHRQRIDDFVGVFSKSAIKSLPRVDDKGQHPLFIVGMPRSGTSLTEQILASHPHVAGAGELNEINDIVASIRKDLNSTREYPACITELTQPHLARMARRYLNKLEEYGDGEDFISDKMPHNFLNLGLIRMLFPNCRIIHCSRDPRDTCLSIYFQSFGWIHPYGARLEWLGGYYREYVRMMKHWEEVLEPSILTVRYEDMVQNQEGTTRKILDYCGLEWDDACLDFHKSKRVVSTASYDQVRQKMYTESRARWKNYRKHIPPLIDSLDDALDGWPDN